MKKIVYVDMDNVLVDFPSGISQLDDATVDEYEGRLDEVPGIFSLMAPLQDAIESFKKLKPTLKSERTRIVLSPVVFDKSITFKSSGSETKSAKKT